MLIVIPYKKLHTHTHVHTQTYVSELMWLHCYMV